MKKITIILPLHKLDEAYSEMLKKAVESIEEFHNDVNLLIVSPSSIKKELEKESLSQKLEIKLISNNSDTDFCSQINLGVNKCETEWFSILEVDDVFRPIWLKSMNEYMNSYPDVDVFLTIIRDVNSEGKLISFTNEAVWAYGFSDKQGYLDNSTLMDFQNFQISGGLYKTSVIKENGILKNNIRLTFAYEFLLRLTNNSVKIMTVPRLGYQHVNFREDSLFWNYKNEDGKKLTENEVKFWIDIAKKEFFYKNKREINYVES